MNQRYLLALVLTAIVIVITPLVFSKGTRPTIPVDSAQLRVGNTQTSVVAETAVQTAPLLESQAIKTPVLVGDTLRARSPRAQYLFSNAGGAPVAVTLDSYPSRRPGSQHKSAELIAGDDRLVRYTLVTPRDTIALDTVQLARAEGGAGTVEYSGVVNGAPLRISYAIPSTAKDDYLLHVNVSLGGAPENSSLHIQLAKQLFSNEPDTSDDLGHLAISYRPARGSVESVGYSKLDTVERRVEQGPLNWVGIRNKYFLIAVRGTSSPFSGLSILGVPKTGRAVSHAATVVALPLKGGTATFDIYSGPQDFERLQQLGGDLDQVNPYAGWFHGVVQPVAAVVMRVLLWMKRSTHLNYGWVLVLFGVAIRLLLWPLNQSAMRTSMKMQRLQPSLQALQKKHSDDPQKQQEAIMKLYKEHDMSPLSPLMGCLPMLLPMPVLFALYFVFNNTIEFRGVSFLWLPDISLRDPYFITPLLMGASMYLMSWIGMRNAPPNPQAKMMSYMMPVMLTALFFNFASGLNLYYAVQNLAAIPQQWLLAQERGKNPPPETATVSSGRRKRTA